MLIKLITVTTQVFKPTRWKPTSTTEHDCRAAAEGHAGTCRLSGDFDLDDDEYDDDDDYDDDIYIMTECIYLCLSVTKK